MMKKIICRLNQHEELFVISRIDNLEHLVILGAGATCAAYPYGDNNGKPIPGMNGFMEKTGLVDEFPEDRDEIETTPNLESLFSKWHENPEKKALCDKLERTIQRYFSELEPIGMNLYVKLLLSLTNRDVIATFNWDPLLSDSYKMLSREITHDLPRVLFLHGNVAMGYCLNCMRVGYLHDKCEKCGSAFVEMPLLYPIEHKNYNEDIYIRSAWKDLEKAIIHSTAITFFGYSAPKSDAAAIAMMKQAFSKDPLRNVVKYQLINIADESELRKNYGAFEVKQEQLSIVSSFYDSFIARYPRRSADYLRNCGVKFYNPKGRFEKNEKLHIEAGDDIFTLVKKVNEIDKNALHINGLEWLERAYKRYPEGAK